tara:strand:+ start:3689 stop:4447 length:759 start_codon:yes stop_codon:yes gene_type:complete
MSLKSVIQTIIILIIIIILGGVYYNYFANNSKITLEKSNQTEIDLNETKKNKKITDNPDKQKIKVDESIKKNIDKKKNNVDENKKIDEAKKEKDIKINIKKEKKPNKPKIDNIVKDIEYLTTDKNGNKYKILATSGRTNSEDKNILDLDNVRGVITSNKRSTVYIVSDFAEYNSSNLKSNFYQNVVINYEDKEITCDYFDVDMKTNIAKAYNNVVLKDPKSTMKAGKIILNIETKVIDINPENNKKVSLTIN